MSTPMSKSASEVPLKHVPQNFDSLDARLVQYNYAIVKLRRVLRAIDDLLQKAASQSPPLDLLLVQYIIYLSATVFAINESGFAPRLAALENFKPLKPSPVTISQVVTHVAYDVKDQPIVPLEELPSTQAALSSLKSFRAACVNCLEGYQKRFVNALREINNQAYVDDLDTLFNSVFFDQENDLDLSLACAKIPNSFFLPLDPKSADVPDIGEASLIDMDIYALFTLTLQMSGMLAAMKPLIGKFREVKQTQKQAQELAFKALPHSEYSFHRILFWALRLNDLYSIIRRFGRQVYIGNYEHLHDNKFLSQMANGAFFRTSILKDIDNFFNTSKKNGILIATITRFIRMNSKYEVKAATVLEFVGFIQQSFTYLETLNNKFQEFGLNWIAGELSFRRMHGLPTDTLSKLNAILQEEVARDARLKRELALQSERARAKHISKPVAKPKEIEKPSPQPPSLSKLVITRTSRSSSIGSGSPGKASPVRDVPKNAASPVSSPTRPLSMIFLNGNSSSSSLQALATSPIDKNKIVNTTTGGRRRSTSQPLAFNGTTVTRENGLRSPSGSIRRAQLPGRRTSIGSQSSPVVNKVSPLNIVNETESEPAEVRLTANQKFQQHLREASKSGALFAQEKETFTNVLFDPNNPSATKLKRYIDPPKIVSPPPKEEKPRPPPKDVAESSARASLRKAQANLRPTVAQVTKLNTQKNSVSLQVPEGNPLRRISGESLVSDGSQVSNESTPTAASSSAGEDGSMGKKVRFTGVPDYTPAEDAPSSQSSRILKNFAAFKMPLISRASHAAFKKKDQLLKKEESLLFKQQLH